MDSESFSRLPEPRSLKTLASDVEYPNGNNLLHQFVLDYSRPDNSCVQSYINAVLLSFSGIPANARNRDGYTALHLAVMKRNYLMVRKLKSCLPDIDVNAKSLHNGLTTLHLAISLLSNGHDGSKVVFHTTLPVEVIQEITNIIEFLISSGSDLGAYDRYGASPLDAAVRTSHFDTVKLLVEKGAVIESSGPLSFAIERNRIDILQFLISKGANVNMKTIFGENPLHIAVETGSLEMVKVLVQSGAVVHIYDDCKTTPLRDAMRYGYIDIGFYLIESCGDLNFVNKFGNAPLHDAVEAKSLKFVKVLVERGADVNVTNCDDDTPLHVAVKLNQIETIKFLIKSGGSLNAVNKYGCVPLHKAVETLRIVPHSFRLLVKSNDVVHEVFESIIDFGDELVESNDVVDVKNDEDDYDDIYLLNAALQEHVDTVIFLIESGADLTAVDKLGNTPLYNAVQAGSFKIVKTLVERGAVVDIKNIENSTPLHLAAKRPHIEIEIVKFLISNGADVNALGGVRQCSPLHNAVQSYSLEVVKVLVERGAVVDAVNCFSNTPLHCAAKEHRTEIAEFLINSGADLNAIGNRGKTPLHYAIRYDGWDVAECFDMVKLLEERGADVDYSGAYSRTPLELAVIEEHEDEMIQFLRSHGASVPSARKRRKAEGRSGIKRLKLG